jgi:hypothetical protein
MSVLVALAQVHAQRTAQISLETEPIPYIWNYWPFLYISILLSVIVVELWFTWIAGLTKNILYPFLLTEARGSAKAGRNVQDQQGETVNSSSNLQ